MKKLADFSFKHPIIVIMTIILITFVAVYFARGVTMTTDIKDFFPEDDPRVMTYDHVEEIYGSGEYIMVALETDDVFNQRTLENIDRLSREFEDLQGVSSVQSLTAIDDIKGVDGDLRIEPLVDEIPEDEESLNRLKEDVLSDEMFGGFILSRDSQATLIISEINPDYDSLVTADEIGGIVGRYDGPERIYLTGTPVLNNVLAESMQADLKFLVPLVLLMIGLILWFVFKSLRGILLPFASVGFSLVWTIGFMGVLNKNFSPINAVMPVILISLGTAFGIFILKRYYEEMDSGLDSKMAIITSITSVGVAVLMAGGTTAAGFASNLLSDITLIQEFGLFTGFGVLAALFISLTFIPAVISLLGEGKARQFKEKSKLEKVLVGAIDRPKLIIGITMIILIVSLAGLPRIEIDSNFFNFFAEDSEPRIAYDFIRDKFNGSESVEIIVEGDDVTEPQILQSMESFQQELYETGMVGRPTSLTDIISKTNVALQTEEGDNYYVPDSANLISQYLLLIEMNDSQYLERFLTFEEDGARIQALVKDTGGSEIERLMAKIDDLGEKHFGDKPVEMTSTGIIVLIDALAGMIIDGQLKSIITALIAVFFIVYLLLRSWQGSILSVLLVGFLTVLNFGIMGWAGISLDVVTVLISSIGIGVGVDYAIMVYARYLEERKKGLQVREAVVRTVETIGSAIMSNAIAVISGFIILIFSSFPPFRFFGILVTTLMLAAAAGSIFVIPAIIIQLDKIRR